MSDPDKKPDQETQHTTRDPRPGDHVDPLTPVGGNPYGDRRTRGLSGAVVAVVLIVLGVLAFSLFGGFGPEPAPPQQAQTPRPDNTTTGSIDRDTQPDEQVIPPLEPNDPAEPLQPSPAN